MIQKRHVVGKTIVDFHPNPFPDGKGGTAHDPVFVLSDGSKLRFVVEETETGEYGVHAVRDLPERRFQGNTPSSVAEHAASLAAAKPTAEQVELAALHDDLERHGAFLEKLSPTRK